MSPSTSFTQQNVVFKTIKSRDKYRLIDAPVKNWSLTVSPRRLFDLSCLQYNEYSDNWRLQHCGLSDIFI